MSINDDKIFIVSKTFSSLQLHKFSRIFTILIFFTFIAIVCLLRFWNIRIINFAHQNIPMFGENYSQSLTEITNTMFLCFSAFLLFLLILFMLQNMLIKITFNTYNQSNNQISSDSQHSPNDTESYSCHRFLKLVLMVGYFYSGLISLYCFVVGMSTSLYKWVYNGVSKFYYMHDTEMKDKLSQKLNKKKLYFSVKTKKLYSHKRKSIL